MRRWRIQGTVLTSGIAYKYPYSQHFKAKSVNRNPTSTWRLCHSEQLAQITLIGSQQGLLYACCFKYQTSVIGNKNDLYYNL